MIESIEILLLAIPFLLAAAFVFQTMADTSRKAAWAAPATVRSTTTTTTTTATTTATTMATTVSNVTELFGTPTAHDDNELAVAA